MKLVKIVLNSLINCEDFINKFFELLDKLPEVVTIFPLLFALSKTERDKIKKGKMKLEIIDHIKGAYEVFAFDKDKALNGFTNDEKEKYYNWQRVKN